jgi:UDP-N-acetylmuramate dehydrogenase
MEVNIQAQVSLASMTSWQVGGVAEYFYAPNSIEQLKDAVQWAKTKVQPISILSGGSNVLVSDEGVPGLVIYLGQFKNIKHEIKKNRLYIYADAGCSKTELLKIFLRYKLAPSLFLAGLPGDVGGGLVMNAGVGELLEPREFCEIIEEFEVLDTDTLVIKNFKHDQIKWNYRHAEGWQPGIITRVTLSWPMIQVANILDEVKKANRNRFEKQPLEFPSCGSVFMNPAGLKSARLIDGCGLKGHTIGGAQVSQKHANFIVNFGNAKARDIHQLIEYVQKLVQNKTGILLKTEVVYLGKW